MEKKTSPIRKIALISPFDNYLNYGLRTLSSYLRHHGIETKIICFTSYEDLWQVFFKQRFSDDYNPEVLEDLKVALSDCDAVGVTMMTMDRKRVAQLLEVIRPLGLPTILGGVHPTTFPDDALKLCDMINIGEGYESLLDFCRDPSRTDIKNMWFRVQENGEERLVRNVIRPALANLDDIPFPDFSLGVHLVQRNGRLAVATQELQEKFIGTTYHLFASQGCPFSCTFCINNKYKKMGEGYKTFRFHSVDYLIQEIKWGLSLSPHIEYINFPDDGFIFLKEEYLREFVEGGLKRLRAGLQSGHPETLRAYKRPSRVERYRSAHDMMNAQKSMVFPYYDVIVDNPLIDSKNDAKETLKFLLSLPGPFTLFLYSMRMYPGTEIFEKARVEAVSDRYYDDSYIDYEPHFLNFLMGMIQAMGAKRLVRFLLNRVRGDRVVPRSVFKILKLVWLTRLSLEHLRKKDMSAFPLKFVKAYRKLSSVLPAALALPPRMGRPTEVLSYKNWLKTANTSAVMSDGVEVRVNRLKSSGG